MEVSTRNYLVRLLEKYKNTLEKTKINGVNLEYELKQIELANGYLLGKKVDIALGSVKNPTNYIVEKEGSENGY